MPPPNPDALPLAWVLRCACCQGGLVYAVTTPTTLAWLRWLFRGEAARGEQVEYDAIDRLWEIDYCTCEQDLT